MSLPSARAAFTASSSAASLEYRCRMTTPAMRLRVRSAPPTQQAVDLPDCNHREETDEEQEAGEEQPEAPDQGTDLDGGRPVHRPARGQERMVQRRHDDDEPLEPHPD